MFKTLLRKVLPNPLDQRLKVAQKKGHTKFLLAWNRGLGDIALGLYAIIARIQQSIPQAEITFLIRENLQEGFSLLPSVKTILAPHWKRGEPYEVSSTLKQLGIDPKEFDQMIEEPNPTYWVKWQLGKLTPKLTWPKEHDAWVDTFPLNKEKIYVGVQVNAETAYGLWRNWPEKKWKELFFRMKKYPEFCFVLFGFGTIPPFEGENILDLRGKTTLFQMLSLIKNRCQYLMVPDSGILSMTYYLDVSFPLTILSLWGDPRHGVLKQGVPSPNPQLIHIPLIGEYKNLSSISVETMMSHLLVGEKKARLE